MNNEEMKMMPHVSSNPHIRGKVSTDKIMLLVIVSLLPACGVGVYNFGLHALLLLIVSVVSAVLTEFLFEKIVKKPVTIRDFSAVLTGLLLGMNLPPMAPWWIAVIGSVFAILVVKMLFGGLGQNFMNPALGARCFLVISFAKYMTDFSTADAVSSATPLAALKAGAGVNLHDMIFGNTTGVIGETSVIAIVFGACILILAGVIDIRIPYSYIISFAIFYCIFGGHGFDMYYLSCQIAGGGLMLGAFFMATDYVTSPITPAGKIVYGIFLGILTGIFRVFGASAEGVSYAIIIGNMLVPLIEKVTIPKPFGKGGERR